jgi:hypothetical protein
MMTATTWLESADYMMTVRKESPECGACKTRTFCPQPPWMASRRPGRWTFLAGHSLQSTILRPVGANLYQQPIYSTSH